MFYISGLRHDVQYHFLNTESSPSRDSSQELGFPDHPVNGISAQHTRAPDDKVSFLLFC